MPKHDHSHDDHTHSQHGHTHKHGHSAAKNVLITAVILTFSFAIIEAVSGWLTSSLVLLSDAGHMASDSLALGIAAFAAWVANKPPSEQHTYGYGRAEIIGAWISSLLMVGAVIAIVIEAIARFNHPALEVSGGWVMIVASIGLIINLSLAWVLSKGEENMNMRAAMLHVMGDVLGSIAALISGAVIYFTQWTLIDPILSIFICILILFSSLQLLRESLQVLMEGVPLHIDAAHVGNSLASVAGVKSIHDLHIWTLSSGVTVLSAHVEIDEFTHWNAILKQLRELLAHQFGIDHVTLQPEICLQISQPDVFKTDS